ncbi:hypothetical protein CYMTET_24918 [Cymbomonas tetramitiformis]|uniref:Asl1-like glycosyl hydrolase catalytic domain-containing protein n=1 Tax=Cymbomonas tetramitiformis TaxID=36881 RepID=A0AAE0FUW0_9CHLO|nr:hypothetical protein CYMTET_24918 [Cymbomonas tetramitiformis]
MDESDLHALQTPEWPVWCSLWYQTPVWPLVLAVVPGAGVASVVLAVVTDAGVAGVRIASWGYTWEVTPSHLSLKQWDDSNVTFMPMIWGSSQATDSLREVPENAAALLGFNEPNFDAQVSKLPRMMIVVSGHEYGRKVLDRCPRIFDVHKGSGHLNMRRLGKAPAQLP